MGQLDDLKCKIESKKRIIKIIRRALVRMKAEKVVANLYLVKGETLVDREASVASSNNEKSSMIWHRKLGHMSEQGMKILMDRKLLPGLTKVSLPFCEQYVISNQHRIKFVWCRFSCGLIKT